MEDSGIDSEDKQSSLIDELSSTNASDEKKAMKNNASKHMEDLEVVFRNASSDVKPNLKTLSNSSKIPSSQPLNNQYNQQHPESSRDTGSAKPPNTCRILQRKLELKVERAKRNYQQYREDQSKKSHSSSLIPIECLPIPGGEVEHKPLVDYISEHSDDDEDEISFFPPKRKDKKKQNVAAELTDTFSIQEMTIDSDLDSDDSGGSQTLELLPPLMKMNWFDKLKQCFSCFATTRSIS